jgi:glycosyltransferase involved in cell wall biosynthesis
MLTDFYQPTVGGIERHIAMLGSNLQKTGHQVAVCTVRQRHTDSLEKEGEISIYRLEALVPKIPFTYLDAAKKYHPPTKDPGIIAGLKKVVREFKPDVVHSHGWIVFSYLPLKRNYDVPIIATLHNYGFMCPRQDLFYMSKEVCTKALTRECYKCAAMHFGLLKSIIASRMIRKNRSLLGEVDKFLAVSRFVRDVHKESLGIPEAKISRVANFFEPYDESKSQDNSGLPEDFILFVGALMPHKGPDILIEAHRSAKVNLPLLLMGTKHLEHNYADLCDNERIILMENPLRAKVVRAFEECTFVVIPSICADACPLTVLEAMRAGKAVIASNTGGIPDMILDGETGLLVPPGDVASLSKAIKTLAANAVKRTRMGARAREHFLREFTAEKGARKIENVYREVVMGGTESSFS